MSQNDSICLDLSGIKATEKATDASVFFCGSERRRLSRKHSTFQPRFGEALVARVDDRWVKQTFPDLANIKFLDSGGQKIGVYRATCPRFGDVVVKLFSPQAESQQVVREIQATTQVISKRVVRICEAGVASSQLGNVIWVKEPFVPGENLRTSLKRGPLPQKMVYRLTLQLLDAATACEQVGIVHRDIKPENIMLSPSGDYFLLDFGLARHLLLTSLTPTANVFGACTPGYAPNEQFRNRKKDIDSRADLFAIGVTTHEVVSGSNFFRAGATSDMEVLRRVEQFDLPRIQNPAYPSVFVDFICTLGKRMQSHRPRSCSQALRWLLDIYQKNKIQA